MFFPSKTSDINLTTKEIQSCSLAIMKYVDLFCRQNNIKYCLAGGTLIGAIRHKGFIPWDDDLDIQLTRIEYTKLIQSFNDPEGRYKIFAPELGNSFLPFARICDMKRTTAIPYCPWCKEDTGIFIDVCAEDGVPDSLDEQAEKISKYTHLIEQLYQVRGSKLDYSPRLGIQRTIKLFGKKLFYGKRDIQSILQQILNELTIENYTKSSYVGVMTNPIYGIRERHRKKIFESYIDLPFEDTSFMVVAEYDELLRNIFGDYMQLPPKEKQRPSHSEHVFYWRTE